MTTTVPAYVAHGPDSPLEPGTVERRPVGPRDVRIEIEWAGICHSDIHTVHGDWGPQTYPLAVGHEIAGTVAEVGPEVDRFEVGQRVGVGCMVGSCRECDNCLAGREQYCVDGFTDTYGAVDRDGTITQGGYSKQIVVDEHYVLSLPAAIPFAKAAPLLCAGITTYSPLKRWGAGPGTRVAVVGLGGLGHMAVKIAVALGAQVTV